MKNIDRITQFVTKNGSSNIIIHTIPGTRNWIIGQKVEPDKWLLTLADPMGSVVYNLGMVTNNQHLEIWHELVAMEYERRTSQRQLAKELKEKVYKFIKKYEEQKYKKFTKVQEKIQQQKLKIRRLDYKKTRKRSN